MPFNLITTPWLEVRRASGVRAIITPDGITDGFDADPILALDFPRPDWNAALTEWLIGLCFLAIAPADADDWADRFVTPPEPTTLAQQFARFATAFDFDGAGPRAYQDFDPLAALEPKPISGLLIEAPGENALRNNSDLFNKRDGVGALGLPYAAAALITLQTYAPSGGAGHRTSLRGGGPLTTLLAPRRKAAKITTLWDRIWANIPQAEVDAPDPALTEIFPWLTPTRTSVNAEIISGADHPPGLAFFACPRRIRLIFGDDIICGLSGRVGPAATGLRTQNYGGNYLYWRHPLSPYRSDKKSGDLPLHPQSGPANYGDWLAWWGFGGKPAQCLVLWPRRRDRVEDLLENPDGIEALGFDMDNMKARQWLQAEFPWVPVHDDARLALITAIAELIDAADKAARALTRSCKLALYGQRQGQDGYYRLPETLDPDALKQVGERFWRDTETAFREKLAALQDLLCEGEADPSALKLDWLAVLRAHSHRIFAATVDLDGLTNAEPRRLLWARNQLALEFADYPKASIRKALKLAASAKPKKEAR